VYLALYGPEGLVIFDLPAYYAGLIRCAISAGRVAQIS